MARVPARAAVGPFRPDWKGAVSWRVRDGVAFGVIAGQGRRGVSPLAAKSASIDSRWGVIAVAAISIRGLDDHVKEQLRVRAASHGRSMEAEIRAILTEAVSRPDESVGLARALLDGFGAIGGVDLDLPPRTEPARWADFS
jgi:plasmid stability protein